ncbi:hypothetical protein DPMN_045033 [Dreissena polymorpha]|uniref:SGNH hydrolase-type esterase domain-containing protein n=1 Tax=Dreissena polymorpha TaxID=45954 RepID=A0A9D4HWZ5_DREPO|nr:hypothetical protein DPMN_045033 [Dreissena polymorpha]
MAAPISKKVYIFGHSFVNRLKDFIRHDPSLRYDFGLTGSPMIQYTGFPGATVGRLRNNLENIVDFNPDIVVLVIGTNDIFDPNHSTLPVASAIRDLVDTLIFCAWNSARYCSANPS